MRYAKEHKTDLTEDLARMVFVRFCEFIKITLPPEYQRRMSKIWFLDFIARHPFLYTGIISFKTLMFVFSNHFQIC